MQKADDFNVLVNNDADTPLSLTAEQVMDLYNCAGVVGLSWQAGEGNAGNIKYNPDANKLPFNLDYSNKLKLSITKDGKMKFSYSFNDGGQMQTHTLEVNEAALFYKIKK
ncbi:MAG: hypothetical protein ACON35_01105 [Candidatus Marinamargulisbacteria bacterium]